MVCTALDKKQIRRSFANAAQSYDAMAALQRQVGRELISKIDLPPEALVIDVGCGTGFFTWQLQESALLSRLIALDIAIPMLLQARARLKNSVIPLLCADIEQLPFASNSIDALVSNLALQWCQRIEQTFADVYRVLTAKGQFIFSTFGESALCELKAAWAKVDDYPHVNNFCSSQLIKQQLQTAGFVDVRIASCLYPIKYDNVIELMRELKGIGAHNVNQARNKQLTTKGQLQALLAAYPKDKDGRITASYEVIYVQANHKLSI